MATWQNSKGTGRSWQPISLQLLRAWWQTAQRENENDSELRTGSRMERMEWRDKTSTNLRVNNQSKDTNQTLEYYMLPRSMPRNYLFAAPTSYFTAVMHDLPVLYLYRPTHSLGGGDMKVDELRVFLQACPSTGDNKKHPSAEKGCKTLTSEDEIIKSPYLFSACVYCKCLCASCCIPWQHECVVTC